MSFKVFLWANTSIEILLNLMFLKKKLKIYVFSGEVIVIKQLNVHIRKPKTVHETYFCFREMHSPNATRFITRFNTQSEQIHIVFYKHWHILTEDDILRAFVDAQPSITYRCNQSIKDMVTFSQYMAGVMGELGH